MEVKIGVKGAPRELVVETESSADEVAAALRAVISDEAVLELTDVKGRRVLVPAEHIAFVELGEPEQRRVGFAM